MGKSEIWPIYKGKKRKLTQTVPKEAQILKKIINQRANRNNRHHSRRSMFHQIENISEETEIIEKGTKQIFWN